MMNLRDCHLPKHSLIVLGSGIEILIQGGCLRVSVLKYKVRLLLGNRKLGWEIYCVNSIRPSNSAHIVLS
jgi:hypothetical protein